MYFAQDRFELRCEWGAAGLRAVAAGVDAIVIVDVLSFCTAVDVAVSRGATVYPYRWKDESAKEFAAQNCAIAAGPRGNGGPSLSPASLLRIAAGSSVVLPSPNGSALSLGTGATPTYAACLRNAPSVAQRAAARGRRVAVVAAGERWADDSLRPCVEDLVGAGAVLADLPGRRSPEAEIAVAAFLHVRENLGDAISHCSSGRELIEAGFPSDVQLAAQYAVSSAAPMLVQARFVDDSYTT